MQVKENNPNYKHGGTFAHKQEYNSWRAMRERCNNKNYRYYHRYGGRGITYCDEWELFSNFLRDMGKRPQGCTLDRIDNNGDYCPSNCRWATQSAQISNSTRKTKAKVTKEMLDEAVCSPSVVYKRIRAGWSVENALCTPVENQYEKAKKKALARHRTCPVCGEKCPHARDRYCCKEHFRMSRGTDGKFTKEVQDVKEQKAYKAKSAETLTQ